MSSSHRINCNGFDILVGIHVGFDFVVTKTTGNDTSTDSSVKDGTTSSNKENCDNNKSTDVGKNEMPVLVTVTQEKAPSKKRSLADLLKDDDASLDLLTSDDLMKCGAKQVDYGEKKGSIANNDGWLTSRKNKKWLE